MQSDLDADLENLRRYYALAGYTQAVAGPAQVERTGQDLRLVIPIQEGPRERVVKIDFQGITSLDLGALRKTLPLQELGGFHPVLLDGTLDALRAAYAAKGYTRAQLSARQDWTPDHTLVSLTIEALEGPRQVVDRILVRGNQRTQGNVIQRTIDLDRGEPVSQATLFETERSLYQLGIFSRVDVEFVPSGLEETERDVLIRVEEGKPRSVLYGIGWDSEGGVRGSLAFTDNNVWGKAYSLRTDLRWSQRDKRFHVLFNQPYLGERPVSLTSTVFYEQEAPRDRPYEVTRYGARAEAVRVYGNRRVSLGIDSRIVEPSVDPGIASNEIERLDQPYQVTSLVPTFFWDRRDDPLSPTRGWSTLAQIQYAFPVPAFRTDTEFLKLFAAADRVLQPRAPGGAGGEPPRRHDRALQGDPHLGRRGAPLPQPQRPDRRALLRRRRRHAPGLWAGRAGHPRGDAHPQPERRRVRAGGGDGLLLFNLEYRFPVFGDFGGSVFLDSGNVWADWHSISLGDLKNGIGLGARYNSPIGPIRAGIGFKLNREPGESGYALFVNIGNPF